MNIKNLIALALVVSASFIQVGCGTATPTTAGYGSMAPVNGMCTTPGYTLVNGMCQMNGAGGVNPYQNPYGNGNNPYNNGGYGNTGAGGCQMGSFYIQGGYMSGVQVQPGCYQQGQCYQGYVYVQQAGLCVLHN